MINSESMEKLSQSAHYQLANNKNAQINELFLYFVSKGLTRKELEKLIEKRPHIWGRFSKFLDNQ